MACFAPSGACFGMKIALLLQRHEWMAPHRKDCAFLHPPVIKAPQTSQTSGLRQASSHHAPRAHSFHMKTRRLRLLAQIVDGGPLNGPLIAGRYLLGERLGSGGAAVVRRGWDTIEGRPVALKSPPRDGRKDVAVAGREMGAI